MSEIEHMPDGTEPEDAGFDPEKMDPVFRDFLVLMAMSKRLVLDLEADKNRSNEELLEVQILQHIEDMEESLGVTMSVEKEPMEILPAEESGPASETK